LSVSQPPRGESWYLYQCPARCRLPVSELHSAFLTMKASKNLGFDDSSLAETQQRLSK